MARKKVKLEFIANATARKATFKKRKTGLFKKAKELTTLCGVEACAIIYGPYDSQPEVWPNPSGARQVLERFMSFSDEDQAKKMLDQEAYLKQRITKVKQQLEKLKMENKEKEKTELMYACLNGEKTLDKLSQEETNDLCLTTDKTLEEITKRIEFLKKN